MHLRLPIRRAPQPCRTQTCRTDRAQWCAAVSQARPSEYRIEPGGRAQSHCQVTPLGPACSDAAEHKIAVLGDLMPDLSLTRQPAQELACDVVKTVDLPDVRRPHQVPREAFSELDRAGLAEPFFVQRGGKRMHTRLVVRHRN